MLSRNLFLAAVFLLGLCAVCWIGAGYVLSNPLALLVCLLIAAGYLAGALELHRYRQATASLSAALAEVASAQSGLGNWLGRLHPSLRNPVRLRIEGARVPLPAPALTPYLVGLLVLLGMLGTLLGMMATLRGTGLALENAADLQAIRGSLAAPVKGLGFAFGTSIAGVATSAMLGLLSALCRRERLQVVQQLDAEIATSLHPHSQAYQREQAFALLQQQTALMPVLVERLQALVGGIEQSTASHGEQLVASQHAFHERSEAAYRELGQSLQQALQESVSASARAVGDAMQPVVETTLAGLASQAGALHERVEQAVQRQLDGLSSGFDAASRAAAQSWTDAVAQQRRGNEALVSALQGNLELQAERFASVSDAAAKSWTDAVAEQRRGNEELVGALQGSLEQHAERFEQRAGNLADSLSQRLEAQAAGLGEAWARALENQQAANEAMAARNEQALGNAGSVFEQRASALLATMDQGHARLQQALREQDEARLQAWAQTLAETSANLREDWQQAGAGVAERQQAICDALARSANDVTALAQAHAERTIAEISRLVDAAAEAPKAAAEVIAELRQKLSDSMARDTTMLEERTQLIGTLGTLLEAVNHASTEQRSAIDALVATSADLLERVGNRFGEQMQAEASRLETAAAQVAVGASEVASLGEAFASAVEGFGRSSEELAARLAVVEGALEKSLARSDEQLEYYVAQAREVIDLSLLTQRQIIADLQQIGGRGAGGNAA
ncbi:DUF802 domain-containing protein [Stenotrophomonas sp. Marseille-Q4652]|uniref:DUF802 domain-containing protein n=1 Tax=Stenotrophomonas sp. Marseille-Q4652 TaxID=2866595 RepID=UPI001CE3D157|nr:DUF802 domain-containing protein [Stenotrophomonas sp. Marseille-Q4652]